MNVQMVSGVVRHLMTALGGILVAHGVVEAGEIEMVIGAVVTLAGFAWSIWEKK